LHVITRFCLHVITRFCLHVITRFCLHVITRFCYVLQPSYSFGHRVHAGLHRRARVCAVGDVLRQSSRGAGECTAAVRDCLASPHTFCNTFTRYDAAAPFAEKVGPPARAICLSVVYLAASCSLSDELFAGAAQCRRRVWTAMVCILPPPPPVARFILCSFIIP
jgi:hypothetical protein